MATIIENMNRDMKAITKACNKKRWVELKMIVAEICFNIQDEDFLQKWESKKIASGSQKDFIDSLAMEVCAKKDATALLIAGDQIEGCFIIGKSKNYWLKSKTKE